jgi:hypothetical protein
MDSQLIFQAFRLPSFDCLMRTKVRRAGRKARNSNRLRRATNFLVVKYAEESDNEYSLKATTEEY